MNKTDTMQGRCAMKSDIYYEIKSSNNKSDPKPRTTQYRYSRRARKALGNRYSGRYDIIILEGPDRYWMYDEDAQDIASLLNYTLYKTKKGFALVYEKSVHDDFIDGLQGHGRSILVVHPTFEEQFAAESIQAESNSLIKDGLTFRMRDDSGIICQYIIKSRLLNERFLVHHGDGTFNIMPRPILDDETDKNTVVISPRAPLASLLVGKKIGDTVSYNGFSYVIEELKEA